MEYDDKYNNKYNDIKSDISSPLYYIYLYIIPILLFLSVICIYHYMVMNILIKEIDKDEIVDKINNMCSICLEEYIDDRKMSRLKCDHIYHKECIMKWIKNNNECPLCRAEVI
jgi:hypothetical protein